MAIEAIKRPRVKKYGFMINDITHYNLAYKWCNENLSGKFSYTRIEDSILIVILDDEDATAFKLRWQ